MRDMSHRGRRSQISLRTRAVLRLADWFEDDGRWFRLDQPTHWLKLIFLNVVGFAFGFLFAAPSWSDLFDGIVTTGRRSTFIYTRTDAPWMFWSYVAGGFLLASFFVGTVLVITSVLVARRFGFTKPVPVEERRNRPPLDNAVRRYVGQ